MLWAGEGGVRSPPLWGRCRRSRQRGVAACDDGRALVEAGCFIFPRLRKLAPLCPAGHLPHKGGDRLGAGLLPSRISRSGFCPPVSLSFRFAQVEPERTGRLWLPRKSKNRMTPGGAPFGSFCPATSISLRRRPLPGIFQAGPGSSEPADAGTPSTTRSYHHATPHRRTRRAVRAGKVLGCPKPAALPPRRQGRPFSADPECGILRLSPKPRAGPASPQRLVVYPRRNAMSLDRGERVGMKLSVWL